MKRNNGYLELKVDYSFKELELLGIIKLLGRNKVSFYIDSLNYFFKEEGNCYEELIGSEIAKCLGINSVSYDMLNFIASDINFKGVISDDFRIDGYKLLTIDKIIDEYLLDSHKEVEYNDMNLELLEEALSNHYSNYKNRDMIVRKMMDDIKKSFLFDILIGNIDNGKYNYELMENDIDGRLTPYFDYEQIFKFSSTRLTVSDSNNYSVYDNLLEFLNSNPEYIDYFREMYNTLTPEKIEELFAKIEREKEITIDSNYKNIIFLTYSRHYNNIGMFLKQIKHNKK